MKQDSGNTEPDCGCRSYSTPNTGTDPRSYVRDVSEFLSDTHVRSVSEFLDLEHHRSGTRNPDPNVRDASEFCDDPGSQVSGRDPQPRAREGNGACGTDTYTRTFRGYDWSALIPFVDLEHAVVLVDDEENEPDERNLPRRRLTVIGGLEVFEVRSPKDGGLLNIKAKGPGGIPPAPSEGLGLLSPKPPIVGGHDITKIPKPPPIGGTEIVTSPQKGGIQTSQYNCPNDNEYSHAGAHLRFAALGKNRCGSDAEKLAVAGAYWMAYQIVHSAAVEMAEWESQPLKEKQYFWQAYKSEKESTLENWFGGGVYAFFRGAI